MLLSLAVHTRDPSSGEADTEDEFEVRLGCISEFKDHLGYILCLGKRKKDSPAACSDLPSFLLAFQSS